MESHSDKIMLPAVIEIKMKATQELTCTSEKYNYTRFFCQRTFYSKDFQNAYIQKGK